MNFIIKTCYHVLAAQRYQIQKEQLMVVDVNVIKIINGIFLQVNVLAVLLKGALKIRKILMLIKKIKNVEKMNFIIKISYHALVAQKYRIRKVQLMAVGVNVIKIINGIFLQINVLAVHPKDALELLENIINGNKKEMTFD
jgi:hypothetical protein